MSVVELSLEIAAPIEVVFDLSRSVEVHLESTRASGERALSGVTSGLLELGDEVTWQATHFGIRQRLTSRITAFDRPRHFRDSMQSGAFKRFDHDHSFTPTAAGTLVLDRFDFTAPLGPLGAVADWLFLQRYMRRFIEVRLRAIQAIAVSDRAREFLG